MTVATIARHIEQTPGIVGGRPRIAGRRITVDDIVVWHERLGYSVDQICVDYGLTPSQVHAALTYYFDNQVEIDRSIQETDAFVEHLRKCTKSPLAEKLERLRSAAGD